jgi:hypothetical protein
MRQWRAWRHNLQLPSRPTSKDALSSLGRWASNGSTLLSRWHTYPTDCLKASAQVPSQMGRALIRDSTAAGATISTGRFLSRRGAKPSRRRCRSARWFSSASRKSNDPQDRRGLRLARCPIEIPNCRAFCLKAPGVRFRALEIALTGVLLFECFFSSLSSCAVHARTTRLRPLAKATLL